MNKIRFLDVTLRDGGNRVNFHFSDDDLANIIVPLDKGGIDFIEVGYRNGAIRPVSDIGRAGLCDKAYLKRCQTHMTSAKMAVMAHPQNLTADDMVEMKACGVSLLRLCASRGNIQAVCPIVSLAKQFNLTVSVNFIHASQYSAEEMDAAVEMVSHHQPDMIYFADSNGSLLPERVKAIYSNYVNRYNIPFGFHAHDNLGLAQANALSATEAGIDYLDFSLAGMGKGIGNLRTEFFVAYLHALQRTTAFFPSKGQERLKLNQFQLDALVPAANYILKHFPSGCIDLNEFTRGIFDKSTAQINAMLKQKENIKATLL